MQSDPAMFSIKREVERYLYIEKKVLAIPEILPVGPICLKTDPIKDALHGFAMQWKSHFASVLHEEAKVCCNTKNNNYLSYTILIWNKSISSGQKNAGSKLAHQISNTLHHFMHDTVD